MNASNDAILSTRVKRFELTATSCTTTAYNKLCNDLNMLILDRAELLDVQRLTTEQLDLRINKPDEIEKWVNKLLELNNNILANYLALEYQHKALTYMYGDNISLQLPDISPETLFGK
jgi:hypothetical protein